MFFINLSQDYNLTGALTFVAVVTVYDGQYAPEIFIQGKVRSKIIMQFALKELTGRDIVRLATTQETRWGACLQRRVMQRVSSCKKSCSSPVETTGMV